MFMATSMGMDIFLYSLLLTPFNDNLSFILVLVLPLALVLFSVFPLVLTFVFVCSLSKSS